MTKARSFCSVEALTERLACCILDMQGGIGPGEVGFGMSGRGLVRQGREAYELEGG